MRSFRALLHAMHPRRNHRIGPDEAEHLVNGDLRHLFEAARAPATERELAGEKAAVAAFVAHRRSAARAARKRRPASVRAAVVAMAAGLALLTFGGTAVAARTGNLPRGAQQHAHRLFSALGVPAPRTGPAGSTHPSPSPSPTVTELGWCDQWQGKPKPLSSENRRKLGEAAGGDDRIGRYCAEIRKSASPAPPRVPSGSPPPPPTEPTPGGSGPAAPSPSVSPSPSSSAATPPVTPGTPPGPGTSRTRGGGPKEPRPTRPK